VGGLARRVRPFPFRLVEGLQMAKGVSVLMFAVVLMAVPALAADVDGKWAGTLSTPMGDLPVDYEFKADGATLTGTTGGFDGGRIEIKNGKVEGSNISFSVTLDFGGMPLELTFNGVVSPTEITITGDFMGMPFEYVVKKS
jgi:hypothetical protein